MGLTNNSTDAWDNATTPAPENTQDREDNPSKEKSQNSGSDSAEVPVFPGNLNPVNDKEHMALITEGETHEQQSNSGDSDSTIRHVPALAIHPEEVVCKNSGDDNSLPHPPDLPADMFNIPAVPKKWMVETHHYSAILQETLEKTRDSCREMKSCRCLGQENGQNQEGGDAEEKADDWDTNVAGDSWTDPNEWAEKDRDTTNKLETGRQDYNDHPLSKNEYGHIGGNDQDILAAQEASLKTMVTDEQKRKGEGNEIIKKDTDAKKDPEKHFGMEVPRQKRTEQQEQDYLKTKRRTEWAKWVRNHMKLSIDDMKEEMRKKNGDEQEITEALKVRTEELKKWARENYMELSGHWMRKQLRAGNASEEEIGYALQERADGWKKWVKNYKDLSIEDMMKKIMTGSGMTAEEMKKALEADTKGG